MVEVFKTNVMINKEAQGMVDLLGQHFPACKINMDLEDCDKILRVEGVSLDIEKVKRLVQKMGYECLLLE